MALQTKARRCVSADKTEHLRHPSIYGIYDDKQYERNLRHDTKCHFECVAGADARICVGVCSMYACVCVSVCVLFTVVHATSCVRESVCVCVSVLHVYVADGLQRCLCGLFQIRGFRVELRVQSSALFSVSSLPCLLEAFFRAIPRHPTRLTFTQVGLPIAHFAVGSIAAYFEFCCGLFLLSGSLFHLPFLFF
jgi:hypothetical protein